MVVSLRDAFGGKLEQSFTIEVVDAFVPSFTPSNRLRSVPGMWWPQPGLWMKAVRRSRGKKFLVSSLRKQGWDTGIILSESGAGGGAYNQRINGLLPGEKYYIRAYATNAEGTAYGSSLRLETMIHEQAPSWSRAKKSMVGQGWWTSPWFGSFISRTKVVGSIMNNWPGPMRCPRVAVESGFGPSYRMGLDGRGSIPSCLPRFQSWLYFYGKSKERVLFYRYSISIVTKELRKKAMKNIFKFVNFYILTL